MNKFMTGTRNGTSPQLPLFRHRTAEERAGERRRPVISDFHPQLSILLRLSSFAQFAGHSLTSDLSPVSPVAPVALRPSPRAVRSLAPKFSHLLSPVVAIFLPSIFLSQFPSPSLPHRGGEGRGEEAFCDLRLPTSDLRPQR